MSRLNQKSHIVSRLTALLCALFLCAAMMVPAVSAAPQAEGSAGKLDWSLSNGILTISGRGEIPDYTEQSPAPWYPHRESILRVQLGKNIKSVGNMAFYNCTALNRVVLPNAVERVGNMAFAGCESLTTISMPQVKTLGEYAFSRCFALENVTLPETLVSIGSYAFYRCESLAYIRIPASVTTIGSSALAYCSSLLRADVYASVEALPEWCFYGCERLQILILPASVKTAGDSAFTRCEALDTVYHGGTDEDFKQFSDSVADSLPSFTVAQMYKPTDETPTASNKDAITNGNTTQEIMTEVTPKENSVIRVEQTITYPGANNQAGTEPESFDSTIYVTLENQQGWDDVTEAIRDQINHKGSFESVYGEQAPVRVEVTLKDDMSLTGAWLNNLAGRDAVVSVTSPDGSRFTINGKDISGYTFENNYSLNYTLTVCDDLSDADANEVGTATCYWLSFQSAFAFPITVEVLVDPYAANQTATLYEKISGNALQKLQSARVDNEGYVAFRLKVINATTRYLLAVNATGNLSGEAVMPSDTDGVAELLPLDERYAFSDVRGWLGLTMQEFTKLVLTVGGIIVGVILVLVLVVVIRSKRKAKIAAIRAEVMGTDLNEEIKKERKGSKKIVNLFERKKK